MRTPLRPQAALLFAALAAAAAATTAHASAGDVAAYRTHVNALCRTFTPKLDRYAADLKKADATGDVHRAAFDLGALLGMVIVEDGAIEGMRVPPDFATRMAQPLKLLRKGDAIVRRALAAATAGDEAGFTVAGAQLKQIAPPMNAALDGVGLRDCGSLQI